MTVQQLMALDGIPWAVLLVGLVALIVRRRRCPRAAVLGAPGVLVLLPAAAYIVLDRGYPVASVRRVYPWAYRFSWPLGTVLLVLAATADRRGAADD